MNYVYIILFKSPHQASILRTDRNQCDGLVENEKPGADAAETSQERITRRENVCVCVRACVYVAVSLENFIKKMYRNKSSSQRTWQTKYRDERKTGIRE